MWVLEPSGAGGEANSITYLVTGPLSVGRPPKLTSIAAADVIVNGDLSVSKDHAHLQITAPPSTTASSTRPDISMKDLSKFGTFVNNVRVGKQPQQLNEGAIIQFGMKSKFRLKWVPLVFCLSPRARLAESLVTRLRASGISVERTWARNCTHVVVDSRSTEMDAIVACGLISGCNIVPGKWIEAVLAKRVHVGCTPPVSHFPTRLPLRTDLPRESMRVLEGIKLFWATNAEDPFSETLGQLAGGTFLDPNSLSLGSLDDLVALYRGNGSPEDTCGRPLATGCDWTNEKKLLSAILTGARDGFRQPPPIATTLEQASVLSSDEEKDYNTSVYGDTMVATENNTGRSSLRKRKAIEGDRSNPPPTLSEKRQCPPPGRGHPPEAIPSKANPNIRTKQAERPPTPTEKAPPEMKEALQGNRPDQRGKKGGPSLTKPGGERHRGRTGMASILASVLDSDDEGDEMDRLDQFPVFVKPEGSLEVSMSGGKRSFPEEKKVADDVQGNRRPEGLGVSKNETHQTDGGEHAHGGRNQGGDSRGDHPPSGAVCERRKIAREETGTQKEARHRVEESAREEPAVCAMDVDGYYEIEDRGKSVTKQMQKSEKKRCPEEEGHAGGDDRLPERNRAESTGERPEKETVGMVGKHRKRSDVGDHCENKDGGEIGVVFESLIARFRVSGKNSNRMREGVSDGGVNFKTFVKIWPVVRRETAPCFRGTIYKESGFDSRVFGREQQEKEKDARIAEELFTNPVSSRVGLTGRSRVKRGRRLA